MADSYFTEDLSSLSQEQKQDKGYTYLNAIYFNEIMEEVTKNAVIGLREMIEGSEIEVSKEEKLTIVTLSEGSSHAK